MNNMSINNTNKNIYGKYIEKLNCRFCENALIEVFKLGDKYPLAGGFLKNLDRDIDNERVYPLSLSFCKKCYLLQCKEVINSDLLFKNNYFYYSSMIPMLVNHFNNYAKKLSNLYKPNNSNITVIEIGCNDGVFLKPLKKEGFKVIGIDPSNTVKNVSKDIIVYNDYFCERIAKQILENEGKCDIFLSSNSFAHIDNMMEVMNSIKLILKKNGSIIIEVHYSPTIFQELNFDFIYHEHMSYYNVTSFYKISQYYDLTLEDIEFTNIHGKSVRVYMKNNKSDIISQKIKDVLLEESSFCKLDTYYNFYDKIERWKFNFLKLYNELKDQSKTIYGYGSSGRSNIICTYCNIHFEKIVDDALSKIGNYTPVYHVKIDSSDILYDNNSRPDYVIILAWAYADNIIKKHQKYLNNGGKFIVPLPEIKIIR